MLCTLWEYGFPKNPTGLKSLSMNGKTELLIDMIEVDVGEADHVIDRAVDLVTEDVSVVLRVIGTAHEAVVEAHHVIDADIGAAVGVAPVNMIDITKIVIAIAESH